jgi:hypothetical protein
MFLIQEFYHNFEEIFKNIHVQTLLYLPNQTFQGKPGLAICQNFPQVIVMCNVTETREAVFF